MVASILYCIHPLIHLTIQPQVNLDTLTYSPPLCISNILNQKHSGSHTQRETLTPAIISLTTQLQVCWKHTCMYFTVTPRPSPSHSVPSPVSESPSPSPSAVLTSSTHSPGLLHCLRQHAKGIVKGAFCLVKDLLGGSTDHNSACLSTCAAWGRGE